MNKLSRKDIEMLEMLAKTQDSKDALGEYTKQHNKAVKAYKTYRESVVAEVEVDKVVKPVETKRKFKTGDKVRVLSANGALATAGLEIGDVTEVSRYTLRDDIVMLKSPHKSWYAHFFESALELVEEKSPNELRAEVIKKAKEFVEENKNTVVKIESRYYVVNTSFITNASKRTVVALVKGVETRKVRFKGIAKCNPSDVFNEHIGKAIALGRALGKDVSEFENAVQPTLAVGQIVENQGSVAKLIQDSERTTVTVENRTAKINGYYAKNATIINDTNAQYGGVE